MKNFKKRIAIGFLAVLMAFSGTACKRKPITQGSSSSNDITILCSAAVGQPTTANDPYKKYIKDIRTQYITNSHLNFVLSASND